MTDVATAKKIQALKSEVEPQWAYARRREYLQTVLRPIIERCLYLYSRYELCVQENNLVAMTLIRERLQEEVRKAVGIQNELYFTNPTKLTRRQPEVTPAMILRAKQYPYANLMELRRGMGRCPFHEDRDPSFSVKGNYGRCFGGSCGWHGDVIAFYMDKEGVTFQLAVKALQ